MHGDKDYLEFLSRPSQGKGSISFPDPGKGLDLVYQGQNVIELFESILGAYFKAHPSRFDPKLKIIGRENIGYGAVILNKNSPLTPVLQKGFRLLHDTAMTNVIKKRWVGQSLADFYRKPVGDTKSLSVGQVIFCLALMTAGFGLAILSLGIEVVFFRWHGIK